MTTATTRPSSVTPRVLIAFARSPIALAAPSGALLVAQQLRLDEGAVIAWRELHWATLFAELAALLLGIQLVLLALKWRGDDAPTTVDRFVRLGTVLTPRGLGLLLVASCLIICPYEHDEALEAMAIATVSIVDLFVTLALAVSLAAHVRRGRMPVPANEANKTSGAAPRHPSRRLAPTAFLRRQGDAHAPEQAAAKITREVAPAVADAGDAVDESFAVGGLSIPFGFRLRVEQELPARLGGSTRLSLDGPALADSILRARLPQTRRGLYKLPSPEIAYEDLLGFTRVAVPAGPSTELRVLPRVRSVTLMPQMPPKAGAQIVPLTKRPPTEDLFTVREYRPGDDARRVHWRHSVNQGVLHVRVPETKPASPRRLRLVLDTFLPPEADANDATLAALLDAMIEGWTSLARALVRNGDRVTLTAPARDAATGAMTIRDIEARPGTERQWRAFAAELAWQSEVLADHALAQGPAPDRKQMNLVVSAGFYPPSATSIADGALLLARMPDAEPTDLDRPDPRGPLDRFLFSSFPVGAEDNAGDVSLESARPRPRSLEAWNARNAYIWARDWSKTQGIRVVAMQQAAGAVTFVTEAA